eukprot:10040407-Alexandrium_andersonii.AAC.1
MATPAPGSWIWKDPPKCTCTDTMVGAVGGDAATGAIAGRPQALASSIGQRRAGQGGRKARAAAQRR